MRDAAAHVTQSHRDWSAADCQGGRPGGRSEDGQQQRMLKCDRCITKRRLMDHCEEGFHSKNSIVGNEICMRGCQPHAALSLALGAQGLVPHWQPYEPAACHTLCIR